VVVDWVRGKVQIQVARLQLLMRRIRELLGEMEWFSCNHVYKEIKSKGRSALEGGFGT
jgi:hypothetical protein